MESIEVTGKSLAEAKEAAAAKLGVAASSIEVTVLEESKGLFGKSTVRIRASVKAVAPAKAGRGSKAKAEPKTEAKPAPTPEPESARTETVEAPAKKGGSRKKAEPKPVEANGAAADGEVTATQADADQMLALVQEVIGSAGLGVVAKVTGLSGRYVTIQLDGVDVAHLIGKHGEVLNTMQYLINIIAGRRFDNGIRATLDGNHYREKREEALTKLATQIAEQVKQRGEEAVLDALPAFERRVVHKALSEIEGVSTYSEGEEPNRRVVIAPRD